MPETRIDYSPFTSAELQQELALLAQDLELARLRLAQVEHDRRLVQEELAKR